MNFSGIRCLFVGIGVSPFKSSLAFIRQGLSRQIFAKQKQAIETLVDRILTAKQSDPTADVQPLETRIDHLVYQLYNLTPEEIAIVEGGRVAG